MLQEHIENPTHKLFPLRMNLEMANKLDSISRQMRVTKSELVRTATNKFMAEIDSRGVAPYTEEMFTV